MATNNDLLMDELHVSYFAQKLWLYVMIWLPRTTDNSTHFDQSLEIRGIESRLYYGINTEYVVFRDGSCAIGMFRAISERPIAMRSVDNSMKLYFPRSLVVSQNSSRYVNCGFESWSTQPFLLQFSLFSCQRNAHKHKTCKFTLSLKM